MDLREFHNALLQGRGKCVLAVRSDPERYRSEVLWACRELVSFDTQCEGTRSWFVYSMVACYDDRRPFLDAAVTALSEFPLDGDWDRCCALCSLLAQFVADGEHAAWDALKTKYRKFYHTLRHAGPPAEGGLWRELDNFTALIEEMAFCRDAFLGIARDLGRLSAETDWYDGLNFLWLWRSKGQRYRKSLDKAAEIDPLLAGYIRVQEETDRELEAQRAARRARSADPESALDQYLSAETEDQRAEALIPFFHRLDFPGDLAPVMADALSDHERLRHAAWMVLGKLRRPEIRRFGLDHLDTHPEAFSVLTRNFEPRDEKLLMDRLLAEKVDFEENTWWHIYQTDILRMTGEKPMAPRAALEYICDTTYCSMCRADALRQLGRRRMLTTEQLEECLYDSNDETRTYARRSLGRRKKT